MLIIILWAKPIICVVVSVLLLACCGSKGLLCECGWCKIESDRLSYICKMLTSKRHPSGNKTFCLRIIKMAPTVYRFGFFDREEQREIYNTGKKARSFMQIR